jgi:hypothetical protein
MVKWSHPWSIFFDIRWRWRCSFFRRMDAQPILSRRLAPLALSPPIRSL